MHVFRIIVLLIGIVFTTTILWLAFIYAVLEYEPDAKDHYFIAYGLDKLSGLE
jgi:hypothetical protein